MVTVFKGSIRAGLLLLSVLSASAYAGIVDMDWQVEGDGRAFLHEESGLEWLKVTETKGYSLQGMDTELSTTNTYDGFRIATESEVNVLMSEMLGDMPNLTLQADFPDYLRYESTVFADRALMLSAILSVGQTNQSSASNTTIGTYYSDQGDGLITNLISYLSSPTLYAVLSYERDYDVTQSHTSLGVFLVSDGGATLSSINSPELMSNNASAPVNNVANVSAPAALSFGILALGGALLRRKM